MKATNDSKSYCIEEHSLLIQELNESKLRVFHLERTIKWWSECTANWREKWGVVRAQRNKLREEQIISRAQYKSLTEEYAKLKGEKDQLKSELDKYNVEKKIARIEPYDVKQESVVCLPPSTLQDITPYISLDSTEKSLGSNDSTNGKTSSLVDSLRSDSLNESAHCPFTDMNCSDLLPGIFSMEEERIMNMVPVLQEELESLQDYAMKIQQDNIQEISIPVFFNTDITEKLDKIKQHLSAYRIYMQQKNRDIHDLQSKTVELRQQLQKKDMSAVPSTSLDGFKTKELQNEIRRLQQENCNEWTRREQAESRVAEIQRKLNSATQTILELQEELSKTKTEARDSLAKGMQLLNEELNIKSKTLIETKAYVSKLKKHNSEKDEALTHEKKRTAQYECEVKKLRGRITELKQELLTAEDKIDHQGNDIRRLQRSLDDQSQATEVLQAQVHHIQSRLKRQNITNHTISVDVETSTNDAPSDVK